VEYSKEGAMPRPVKRKEEWTVSFNPALKSAVVQAAKRRGVDPVTLLEHLAREKFNAYGYRNVNNSAAYVAALRKHAHKQSDEDFLADIEAWQKSRSS
jgi:hypothetical protein